MCARSVKSTLAALTPRAFVSHRKVSQQDVTPAAQYNPGTLTPAALLQRAPLRAHSRRGARPSGQPEAEGGIADGAPRDGHASPLSVSSTGAIATRLPTRRSYADCGCRRHPKVSAVCASRPYVRRVAAKMQPRSFRHVPATACT